jgi:dethiobiotin synthetase
MIPLRGLFVTGTDTGVGKTLVAAGLARFARRLGLTPIPFKPVETGCDPDPLDALCLWRAAQPPIAAADVCLYALHLPAAPALAAAAENQSIDLDRIVARARELASLGDLLLVEGAGGLLVPYAGGSTAADLAAQLRLPLLVVARTALGTINHTALTLAEARRRQLPIAGCILSRVSETIAPHEGANADLITAVTGNRPLGTVPFLAAPARENPDAVADALVASLGEAALRHLLGSS